MITSNIGCSFRLVATVVAASANNLDLRQPQVIGSEPLDRRVSASQAIGFETDLASTL